MLCYSQARCTPMLGDTGAEIRGHEDAGLSWLTNEGNETFLLCFMGYSSFSFTVCFIYKLTMHMIYHGSCKHGPPCWPFPTLNCDLIIFTAFTAISFQVRCKFLLSAFCQSMTYPSLKRVIWVYKVILGKCDEGASGSFLQNIQERKKVNVKWNIIKCLIYVTHT